MLMMPFAGWTVNPFAAVASASNIHLEKYVRNRGCAAHASRLVGRRGGRSTQATDATNAVREVTMPTTAVVVSPVVASGGPGRSHVLDLITGVDVATVEARALTAVAAGVETTNGRGSTAAVKIVAAVEAKKGADIETDVAAAETEVTVGTEATVGKVVAVNTAVAAGARTGVAAEIEVAAETEAAVSMRANLENSATIAVAAGTEAAAQAKTRMTSNSEHAASTAVAAEKEAAAKIRMIPNS